MAVRMPPMPAKRRNAGDDFARDALAALVAVAMMTISSPFRRLDGVPDTTSMMTIHPRVSLGCGCFCAALMCGKICCGMRLRMPDEHRWQEQIMAREGTGEAAVAVAPTDAFAYLSNPLRAPEWFAGVQFAERPEGEPRAGMRWRFVQVRSGNRIVPVRMAVYEPPTRFVWRTTHRWPRTNLRWEMRCEPAPEGNAG